MANTMVHTVCMCMYVCMYACHMTIPQCHLTTVMSCDCAAMSCDSTVMSCDSTAMSCDTHVNSWDVTWCVMSLKTWLSCVSITMATGSILSGFRMEIPTVWRRDCHTMQTSDSLSCKKVPVLMWGKAWHFPHCYCSSEVSAFVACNTSMGKSLVELLCRMTSVRHVEVYCYTLCHTSMYMYRLD